jgi:hypothetical protein
MDISTGSWFKYLREEVLTEGLRDIGLPESVVDFIENAMPESPEKTRMYAGNQWKKYELNRNGTTYAQQNWGGFMERTFKDEIQYIEPEDRSAAGNAAYRARTMTPYYVGGVGGKPVVRKEYNDEMIEQNKRIGFVADNIRNTLTKPMGQWRKPFMKAVKALSKAGIESEKVEKVKEELAATMIREFKGWWYNYDTLFSWLNDEPTNYEMIKDEEDINEANEIALADIKGGFKPDQVVHEFEDGYYWYDLKSSNCSVEAERMNHCGTDQRGTLMSLRKAMSPEDEEAMSVSDRRRLGTSDSFITMTWNADERIIYQIKGQGNNAPDWELWDKIDWFIKNSKTTSVHETGEHSYDEDGFEEMNKHLQELNPDVEFEGILDIEGMQEAVDEIVHNHDGEYTGLHAEVQRPDDWGGDGNYAYIYVTTEMTFDINLGWPDIVRRDGDYYSADGVDSGDINDMLDSIPKDGYGREPQQFISEIDLDDLGYELPGEDVEVSYEVVMVSGFVRNDDVGEEETKTAHLRVRITCSASESAQTPEQAGNEVEFISDELKKLEKDMPDYMEAIRTELVDGEYMEKNAYDRTRTDLVDKDFEHWFTTQSPGGALEFDWRATGDKNIINDGGQIPMVLQMYGLPFDRNVSEIYGKVFGGRMSNTHPPRLENPDLNRNMARNLENLYAASQENPGQQKMGFTYDPKYAAKAARLILAEDSHFIIQGTNMTVGENSRYPTQPISWIYQIKMNSNTSDAQIQATIDILDFFNENPKMMNQAAMKTINDALASNVAYAESVKADILSNRMPLAMIRRIDSMYAGRAEANELANKVVMIASWINRNLEQMDEVEKYVAYFHYLRPIVAQRFAQAYHPIQTDGDDAGKPEGFNAAVEQQLVKMGASHSQKTSRRQDPIRGRMGAPRPAQESIEDQINRIDDMLNEIIEVRRYKMNIEMILDIAPESPIEDYKDVIRACKGVTTVNTIRSETRGDKATAIFGIKFALKAQESRKIYLRETFFPYIKGIVGLAIGPSGYSQPQQLTKLREGSILSTYPLISYGTLPQSSRKFPTPRLSIDKIVSDWTEGGVMAYDTPMDANNMRYHVMVPTEELKKYCSTHYRADANMFTGRYKNFIRNGSQMPVYVAIGQNGRVKITGNEDDVWFAAKSGLEELPVFFSYQKQV